MENFCGKFLYGFTLFLLLIMGSKANEVARAFSEHEVVPDVIPIAPEKFLKITYEGQLVVNKGNVFTPTQVKKQPKIEWDAENDAHYTLIMTDPDAPSRTNPKAREFKHWVVANIPGSNINQGEVLAGFVGSGPPQGTGLHRYVFLMYKQPGKLEFSEPRVPNTSREDRPMFKAARFAEKYGLGNPIAGNFYQAEYDDYVPILHAQLSGN